MTNEKKADTAPSQSWRYHANQLASSLHLIVDNRVDLSEKERGCLAEASQAMHEAADHVSDALLQASEENEKRREAEFRVFKLRYALSLASVVLGDLHQHVDEVEKRVGMALPTVRQALCDVTLPDTADFEVFTIHGEDIEMFAGTSGPRESAMEEAKHYAAMAGVLSETYEVVRVNVLTGASL